MASLITAPHHFIVPPRLVGHLNFPTVSPPLAVLIDPRRCRRRLPVGCVVLESCSFGFSWKFKNRGFVGRWCKGWESEGDLTLEAEILEFMKESDKPEVFPTRKELEDAGRTDLVEAIVKKGGWLSLGWDLGNDIDEEEVRVIDVTSTDCGGDERVKTQENGGMDADSGDGVEIDFQRRFGRDSYGGSSVSANSSYSPSFSGRSFEMGDEQETGIEGILARLEKQRNLSFGVTLGKNEYASASSRHGGDDLHTETSEYGDSVDLGRSSTLTSGSPSKGIFNNSSSKLSNSRSVSDFDGSRSSVKPERWQTWSIQRAGFSNSEFEAAEISFNDNQMHKENGASNGEVLPIIEGSTEALNKQKDICQDDIRTRLQQLELELASALCLLRSKSEEHVPKEGDEKFNDWRKLSDAWEFQETEVMNAQDRLRSIRAKLAVLEGKMTLAIIDAQKLVDEKQKRIDGTRRALHLLRTTYIVWPNSASEVLLAGSFDGWTTQRKMEKSSTGIFSVCLKLYPGRYEIKFIVDGIWKTDPLRPVVRNNGYENNLLIIT